MPLARQWTPDGKSRRSAEADTSTPCNSQSSCCPGRRSKDRLTAHQYGASPLLRRVATRRLDLIVAPRER